MIEASRFSQEQTICVIKRQKAGCRLPVCASSTASAARCIKVLEDENARLKKLLAKALLHNVLLKDLSKKNGTARR